MTVRAAGDGDTYIRALVCGHRSAVLAYAVHLTGGDRHSGEDLVQEALTRAWLARPAFAGRGQQRAWLRRVVRNLAADSYRAQKRVTVTDPARLGGAPGTGDLNREVDAWDIAAALGLLSADHRRVLTEIYYRGCTAKQAAASLGIPAGTVKSRLHYALKALRSALERKGITP